MNKTIKRVVVGLSGGVDSSVAALLLSRKNYDVQAVFMKNWEEADSDQHCTAAKDFSDAQIICDILKIPLHSVNFAELYWNNVFEYCLKEYHAGQTPNPDILCNREIKFKAFLEYALDLGADYIATGHYAQIVQIADQYHLHKATDLNKDQTYFLYTINQYALSKTLFPIGDLEKKIVRKLAQDAKFPNWDKQDSTGICFIGERPFKPFLNQYLPVNPGNIETIDGKVLGKHDGLMFYTLGQRQGLGIGGQRNTDNTAWYVVKKDITRNVLVVAQGTNNHLLYTDQLQVKDLHWIGDDPPNTPFCCNAKVRYRQEDVPCELMFNAPNTGTVRFISPERAVTPGQSVVFYQDKLCLGGGIIQ